MLKLVLDDFSKMTGGRVSGNRKSRHHRFIQGFVPAYEDLAVEANDSNFKEKINPSHPLVLAPQMKPVPNVVTKLSGTLGSSQDWQFTALALNPATAGVNPQHVGTPADGSDDASGTTTTVSVTVPSGTNKTLVVFAANPTGAAATSATFDGDAMTLVTSGANNHFYAVFVFDAPAAKTGDVVVTWSTASTERVVSAVTFQGVDQSDSVDVSGTNSGTSTSPSVTLVPTDAAVSVVGLLSSSTSATHTNADWQEEHTTELTGGGVVVRATMYSTPIRDEYPVALIANEHDSLEELITISNLWRVRAHDADSTTNLGIPTGTPASNVGIDGVIFNGKILTSHPTQTSLQYGAISATPSWAATTGNSVASGTTNILKLFEDRCLVVDASSGAFTRRDKVHIVLPDFSMIDGITLGDTFDIEDVGNYQDRYALLFTHKTTSPRIIDKTTVFMWNGVAGDSYDQKFILEGVFRCSHDDSGAVFAFTQAGTTLICSVFEGGGFRELGRLRNVTVQRGNLTIPGTQVDREGDYFVFVAQSSGNTSAATILYWNPFTGDSFFLTDAIASLAFLGLRIARSPSGTFLPKRYLGYKDSSDIGQLYSVTLEDTTKNSVGSDYKSNSIPAPIIRGFHDGGMGRMNIVKVEIEYNEKAPSSSDSIGFTLTTKDEHESETFNTDTATIKDTTANSTDANVTDKRAIIKLGRKATEFAIDLSVTVATTSWDLIIRRVVVYYEPIAISE